jgi:mannose-1-phosphate guanylyltransferase
MQAIVLVGGEGTRLRPLTERLPKPALTLVDRPFLAYMIEWLADHGVDEVILACGFLPDVLREALAEEEERAGAEIRYVAEPEPLGTAGGIRHAADQLGDRLGDRFLALNGDVLTDLDVGALLRAHEERSARATIGLYPVEDASAYGLVRRGPGGEVVEFAEKTGRREPGEVNAGIYALDRSVLDLIPPGRKISIERDVFPRLVGEGLQAVPLEGYWMDIGTPQRYLQATWDILERRVETHVRPSAPGVFIDPAAELAESAEVGPRGVVTAGCRLRAGARVAGSVLLEGCTIGERARVSDSILAPGVDVEPEATLENEVVGQGERVA